MELKAFLLGWAIQFLLVFYAAFAIPRSIIPIKQGWKRDDFKRINKGVCYLITGVMCIIIVMMNFPKLPRL